MAAKIDNKKFELAHEAFEKSMLGLESGTPFSDFKHPDSVKNEVRYKWSAYYRAIDILGRDEWDL